MDSRFDWSSNTGLLLAASLLDLRTALYTHALHLPDFRPQNCSDGVAAAVSEMIEHLEALPAIHGGRTSLKGDSRFGAFTLERNVMTPWRVWVRAHDDHGDFRLLGYKGTVLQIGPAPGQVITFPSTTCGLGVVTRILKDPEVILRGCSWGAARAS